MVESISCFLSYVEVDSLKKNMTSSVAYFYNVISIEGRDWEGCALRPAPENTGELARCHLNKKAGDVRACLSPYLKGKFQ
jgi:hypothetical protein